MAVPLDFYDHESVAVNRGRVYDWALWLDGRPWRLVRGVDFDHTVAAVCGSVRAAARRHGLWLATTREGADVVVVQAFRTRDARERAKGRR